MYTLTHKDHGEVTVQTELARDRHLEAGWELAAPEEKKETKREVKAKQ
jgi:hypothetical protein